MLRRLAPLAAALALAAAPSTAVWAGIALSVGGAEAEFGAGVTRAHGRATDETAFVAAGPSPCLGAGGCPIVNSNAVTNADFDATQARWRVEGYAVGANAGTSVELLVTDLLTLAGLPNTTAFLNFSVRVELDELFATPNANGGADAWYGFELGTMRATEGPLEFQPFFSLLAEEHHYDGYPSDKRFIAPGITATEIPKSYETIVSIPVFLGASGLGSFDIALHSYADTAVQGGIAGVKSFNSAYLGLSATDATISSANGYGYRGYTTAAQVPEPPIHLLALAGLGTLAAARRRCTTQGASAQPAHGRDGAGGRGCAERGVANGGPLGKPRDKADCPPAPSLRAAAKCGACVAALLGIVGRASTFVAWLARIRIAPAARPRGGGAEAP